MKRQADGVGVLPKEGVEQPEKNGNKRIKLLKNEESQEILQVDDTGEKMDILPSSGSHKHKDRSSSLSKNNSSSEHTSESENAEHQSSQNANETGKHLANGSCDEVVAKVSSNDSGEKNHSNSHENSVISAEEEQEDTESVPPVLNHCDLDIHNSESTDSFASEGFEADSCVNESENKVSVKPVCEEKNKDQEKEPSVELDVKESIINANKFVWSYSEQTELEGHTDIVNCVTADEDYILSASADTTVKVWSTEHKSTISTFSGHSGSVTSLFLLNPNQSKILKKKMSFTKVSRIAITASLDCNIKLWSVLEGKELASVYTFNGITSLGYLDGITSLGYLESECLVVIGTEGGKLELWDIASKEIKKSERAHEDMVTDIEVQNNYIYSVSVDGTVKVWIYDDDDIYPLYTRKRKEISSDKTGFKPAHWKTVSVSENIIYLGDSTHNIKVLDWKVGRLRLFKNQTSDDAVCECIAIKENLLFSTSYDSSSDTGGVNVWKLPEMSYLCTLTNVAHIKSLAVVQKYGRLQIVYGGQKLCIWEFDFSKRPNYEEECKIRELEGLGLEIDEKPVEIKNSTAATTSNPDKTNSSNRWCSLM